LSTVAALLEESESTVARAQAAIVTKVAETLDLTVHEARLFIATWANAA